LLVKAKKLVSVKYVELLNHSKGISVKRAAHV